jgi:hypothetical protein
MRAAATSGNTEERGLPSRDKDVAAFLAPEDIFHAKRGSAASLHRAKITGPMFDAEGDLLLGYERETRKRQAFGPGQFSAMLDGNPNFNVSPSRLDVELFAVALEKGRVWGPFKVRRWEPMGENGMNRVADS